MGGEQSSPHAATPRTSPKSENTRIQKNVKYHLISPFIANFDRKSVFFGTFSSIFWWNWSLDFDEIGVFFDEIELEIEVFFDEIEPIFDEIEPIFRPEFDEIEPIFEDFNQHFSLNLGDF